MSNTVSTIKLPELSSSTAHIIQSDAETITIAHKLAESFAVHASQRDRERHLPLEELNKFSQSGLWATTIPKAYGGVGVIYKHSVK